MLTSGWPLVDPDVKSIRIVIMTTLIFFAALSILYWNHGVGNVFFIIITRHDHAFL